MSDLEFIAAFFVVAAPVITVAAKYTDKQKRLPLDEIVEKIVDVFPSRHDTAVLFREVRHFKDDTYYWRLRKRGWLGIFWKTIDTGVCQARDLPPSVASTARALASDPMFSPYAEWPR